jgi:RNA polymerase sigma-70 factor, ECF subfamily
MNAMTLSERDAHFERWMSEHVAILYRVANAFALGADRKDLMQELLLAVWKAIPEFRSESKPSTFIYRVSHNAAMTWKRTQRNYSRKVDELAAVAGGTARSGASTVETDALERLYTAIHQLPELDRSLMLLLLDGLSYAEMAAIHGLSESNVGVRLLRIKRRLAENLQEATHGPE